MSKFQEYCVPTVGTGALIAFFIEAAAAVGVKSCFDSQRNGIDHTHMPFEAVIVFALVSCVMLLVLGRELWRARVYSNAFRKPAYCALIGHTAIVLFPLLMA